MQRDAPRAAGDDASDEVGECLGKTLDQSEKVWFDFVDGSGRLYRLRRAPLKSLALGCRTGAAVKASGCSAHAAKTP